MTRQELEDYAEKKAEIEELKRSLAQLQEECTVNDTVMDYRTGFPIPLKIVGLNEGKYEQLLNIRQKKLDELEAECIRIEEFVESVEDITDRRILRKTFLENKPQKIVAQEMYIHRSLVSKRLTAFFDRLEQ